MLKTNHHNHIISANIVKAGVALVVLYFFTRLMMAPDAATFLAEILPDHIPSINDSRFLTALFVLGEQNAASIEAANAFYGSIGSALFTVNCLLLDALRETVIFAATESVNLITGMIF